MSGGRERERERTCRRLSVSVALSPSPSTQLNSGTGRSGSGGGTCFVEFNANGCYLPPRLLFARTLYYSGKGKKVISSSSYVFESASKQCHYHDLRLSELTFSVLREGYDSISNLVGQKQTTEMSKKSKDRLRDPAL